MLMNESAAFHPLVSVVTITLNSERYLQQCLDSVREQTYDRIEHLVIDGGSTDGTLEIIGRNMTCLQSCVSEPDRGIADAMNKGVALCKGEYVLFLHSDDYLQGVDAIDHAVSHLERGVEILAMPLYKLYRTGPALIRPRPWNFWANFKTPLLHQATLCSRRLFLKLGGFDLDFAVAMDYDFFLRAYRAGVRVRYAPPALSVMRMSGISARRDPRSLAQRLGEERRVHLKNSAGFSWRFLYGPYWFFYPVYRLGFNWLRIRFGG